MGEGKLLAARAALIALAGLFCVASARCQGLQYRERWGYLHLENRRAELQHELQGRDARTRARVAELLLEPDQGVPFRPVAAALAYLRGVPLDDAFLLRATMSAFVLPEVVDPVGDNETCRRANVSLYLPFALPLPAELGYGLEVVDKAGAVVHRAGIQEPVALADLRMAQRTLEVPCGELADGSYEVRLYVLVAGQMPGPKDPVLRWPLHVQRGFQAHAVAAMDRAKTVAAGLAPLPRALLAGLSRQVARAFTGEPFDGGSRALAELERLDRALANVEGGAHLLAGMTGDVALALPAAKGEVESGLGCVLRLPATAVSDGDAGPPARPLVVIAAGAPTYDGQSRRPSAPVTRMPTWTSLELSELGTDGDLRVAFLESPGAERDFAAELELALTSLRELCHTEGQPVVLVCEREAATIVGFQLARLLPKVDAVVMIGGGAIPAPVLDGLGAVPVRYVRLQGLASSEAIERTIAYAAQRREAGAVLDCSWLTEASMPWCAALPSLAAPLREFVRQVAARERRPR
ncbi:MAG: hypothetical protein H6838_19605 [Planctomycetes bacterium]|nr:hypothetical protein [Planctomycetota bacterium]MCB9887705.1 hypothetical protein [Planctomycetota bacterium]